MTRTTCAANGSFKVVAKIDNGPDIGNLGLLNVNLFTLKDKEKIDPNVLATYPGTPGGVHGHAAGAVAVPVCGHR